MKSLYLLVICLLLLVSPSWSIAQVTKETSTVSSPLDEVKLISELSGRPIFAVAGQST